MPLDAPPLRPWRPDPAPPSLRLPDPAPPPPHRIRAAMPHAAAELAPHPAEPAGGGVPASATDGAMGGCGRRWRRAGSRAAMPVAAAMGGRVGTGHHHVRARGEGAPPWDGAEGRRRCQGRAREERERVSERERCGRD